MIPASAVAHLLVRGVLHNLPWMRWRGNRVGLAVALGALPVSPGTMELSFEWITERVLVRLHDKLGVQTVHV